jgi:hypothetical protein
MAIGNRRIRKIGNGVVQSGLTVPHFPKSMIKRPTPGFPELPVKNVLRNEVKVKLKNIQVIDKNQLVILPPSAAGVRNRLPQG